MSLLFLNDNQENRIESLDLLRATAILLVMFWHFPKIDGKHLLGIIGDNGLWGVDLFFVLSGYLIGNQLFRKLIKDNQFSFKSFYFRRVMRTWPGYFFILILYFVLPVFRERAGMAPLWKFLTFTQNFGLTLSAYSHAWSLCIEEQFYSIFPIMTFLLWKNGNRKLNLSVILFLFLFGIIVRSYIAYEILPLHDDKLNQFTTLIYYPTWGRLDGLLLGVSLALIQNFNETVWKKLTSKGNQILLMGVIILIIGLVVQSFRPNELSIIFGFPILSLGFAGIVLSALSKNSILLKIKIPGATFISTISYSIYLVHKQIYHLSEHLLNHFSITSVFIKIPVLFLASFIAGLILHLTIERPFLKLRDFYFQKYRKINMTTGVV